VHDPGRCRCSPTFWISCIGPMYSRPTARRSPMPPTNGWAARGSHRHTGGDRVATMCTRGPPGSGVGAVLPRGDGALPKAISNARSHGAFRSRLSGRARRSFGWSRPLLDPHARLLVSDAEKEGSPTVRVAHEALISRWGQARDFVQSNARRSRSGTGSRSATHFGGARGRGSGSATPRECAVTVTRGALAAWPLTLGARIRAALGHRSDRRTAPLERAPERYRTPPHRLRRALHRR